MAVTIQDVAKAADVSVATVSRVVNNIPLVSESTRQRVLQAIEELGYEPNEVARSLKVRKTNTIGIIIDDITKQQFTMVCRGVTDACWLYGYNVFVANTDTDLEKEEHYLKMFLQKQCDGILVVTRMLTDELAEKLRALKVPVVLCTVVDPTGALSSVCIDNYQSAYDAVAFMYEMGHRSVGFLNGNKENYTVCVEREKAMRDAAQKLGMTIKEEWLTQSSIEEEKKPYAQVGYDRMGEVLACSERPSVVLCINDEFAAGAIKRAEEEGLRVPDDISIMGYNNYWISEWTKPQITTVSQPRFDIGAVGARLLIKKIENKPYELNAGDSIIVPHEIVVRETVKKLV